MRPGASSVAADRQALATFGAAAFEHQPAVFRAHAYEESVRLFAPARIRLKRALALHEPSANDARARRQEPPFYAAKSMVKRTFNGSEALPRVSIRGECVRVLLLR